MESITTKLRAKLLWKRTKHYVGETFMVKTFVGETFMVQTFVGESFKIDYGGSNYFIVQLLATFWDSILLIFPIFVNR